MPAVTPREVVLWAGAALIVVVVVCVGVAFVLLIIEQMRGPK